jgi:hypothetical protein
MILPRMEQAPLYDQYRMGIPAKDPVNQPVTATPLPTMVCPSAPQTNVIANPNGAGGRFAKITYGLNGGTDETNDGHDWFDNTERGVSTSALPIGATLAEITDGTSNTLLLSEIFVWNSGEDSRGAWGMATSCMVGGRGGGTNISTAGSRIITPNKNPDQYGNQFRDAVAHCDNALTGQGRCDDRSGGGDDGKDVVNGARSWHPGGVNVALGDGSGRFVANTIDVRIWYGLLTSLNGEPSAAY